MLITWNLIAQTDTWYFKLIPKPQNQWLKSPISKKSTALKKWNCCIEQTDLFCKGRRIVAVMGPSGCGIYIAQHTWLLDDRIAGGFYLRNWSSTFQWKKKSRPAQAYYCCVSRVLFDRWINCLENVEFPLIYLGVKSDERKKRVEEVLAKMQIMHRKNHYPQQLSEAATQRVAVARAVVTKPRLILAMSLQEPWIQPMVRKYGITYRIKWAGHYYHYGYT